MRRILILGSTGSIGTQALDIVRANPDRFRGRRPAPPKLPTVAWINDPSREALIQNN